MAFYKYKAVAADGKMARGVVEQPSISDVTDFLAQQGLTPLKIDETASGSVVADSRSGGGFSLGGKVADQVTEFTRELAIMLSSSMPLDRSLIILQGLSHSEEMADIISDVTDRVRRGSTLADAFEQHRAFSGFYVNMVRAGEAGGALDVTLTRLAEYMERSKGLRQTVASAMIYPAILLLVAVVSLIVLLGFVVPKFADLFSDMGASLPVPTQVVMAMGDWVANYWWLLAVVIGGSLWSFRQLLQQDEFREKFDTRLLKVPLVGDLIAKMEISRLARTFGTMLNGGVAIEQALSICLTTVGNRALQQDLHIAVAALKEGKMLGEILMERGNFPALALHMIQVGEETGQLEEMLLKIADIYETEMDGAVKRLLALLEPVMILGLGLMIAGIILSILVGILEINELVF